MRPIVVLPNAARRAARTSHSSPTPRVRARWRIWLCLAVSLAVLACEAFVIVPRTAGSRQQPALVFRKRYPTARPLPEALAAAKERLVQRGARVVVESEGRVRLALPYAAGKRMVAIVSADSSREQPALILKITAVDDPENAYAVVRRLRLAVAAAAAGGDQAETEAAPDAAADTALDAAAPESGTPADAGVPATIPVQKLKHSKEKSQ